MKAAFDRISKATGANTQIKLAEILEIKQSSISDAKGRNQIPDSWLIVLLNKFSLNPNYILTGNGKAYLVQSDQFIDMTKQTLMQTHVAGSKLENILQDILETVTTAKAKHTYLGKSIEQAFRSVASEHKKWESQAMLIEEPDGSINQTRLKKAKKESLDCITTHVRFLNGDFIGL